MHNALENSGKKCSAFRPFYARCFPSRAEEVRSCSSVIIWQTGYSEQGSTSGSRWTPRIISVVKVVLESCIDGVSSILPQKRSSRVQQGLQSFERGRIFANERSKSTSNLAEFNDCSLLNSTPISMHNLPCTKCAISIGQLPVFL